MGTKALTKWSYMEKPSSSTYWDDGGRTEIAKIYVSYGKYGVDGVQFVYVENGNFVLGEKHGGRKGHSYNYVVVDLDHESEVVTGIRGNICRYNILSFSLTTNKGTYGPFGGDITNEHRNEYNPFNFQLGNGSSFGGFHGTANRDGELQSIGVYIKP